MKIVFATNNQHKLSEIRSILGESIEVLSLKDIGCDVDIPETGTTLEENALQKAQYVYDHYHISCFADDTGLEVDALNGAPGVYSARYASMENHAASHDSEANMTRLLKELGTWCFLGFCLIYSYILCSFQSVLPPKLWTNLGSKTLPISF